MGVYPSRIGNCLNRAGKESSRGNANSGHRLRYFVGR